MVFGGNLKLIQDSVKVLGIVFFVVFRIGGKRFSCVNLSRNMTPDCWILGDFYESVVPIGIFSPSEFGCSIWV